MGTHLIPYLQRNISIYRNATDKKGVTRTLSAVVNRITSGERDLDAMTKYCHSLSQTDLGAYRDYKVCLPAVTFGGAFHKRNANNLAQHSGLVVLDIDGIDRSEVTNVLSDISDIPFVLFAFISPSGAGIKAILPVNPIPTDASEHKAAYQSCKTAIAEYIDCEVDPSGSDVSRLCFLSHNPYPVINEQALPVEWDRESYLEGLNERRSRHKDRCQNQAGNTNIDLTALEYISPDVEYETWLKVGLACYNEGLDVSVWDAWSQRGSKYRPGECEVKWETFTTTIAEEDKIYWASVIHIAKEHGYIPPKRTYHAKQRLTVKEQAGSASDNDEIRALQNEQVLDWIDITNDTKDKRLLVFEGAAGTGKSHLCITQIPVYTDVSPTKELADEKYTKALNHGKLAVRHKPRTHNQEIMAGRMIEDIKIGLDESRGEVPCAYPNECNAVIQGGRSPMLVCLVCPFFDICKIQGYLSQFNKFPSYDLVFTCLPDIFATDPMYGSVVSQFMPEKAVLVLDEVNPASISPERSVNIETLEELIKDYEGFTASTYLNEIVAKTIRINEPKELEDMFGRLESHRQWRDAIASVHDFYVDELENIEDELGGVPVKVTFERMSDSICAPNGTQISSVKAIIEWKHKSVVCAVVDSDNVDLFMTFSDMNYISSRIVPPGGWKLGKTYSRLLHEGTLFRLFVDTTDVESIVNVPRSCKTLVSDLESFLEEYRDVDIPACYQKDGNWTFHFSPTLNAQRGIFISASGVSHQIQEMYRDTDVITDVVGGEMPAWKDECKLYQISTGRYTPKQSLFYENELKSRGRDFVKLIIDVANNEPDEEILVVTPKAFTAEGILSDHIDITALHKCENITVINHFHGTGVNLHSDKDIVFVLHYEPLPTEIERIATRIYADGNLDFTREIVTLNKYAAELEEVYRYTDERVQRIYDYECERRIMQSLMRLRPNLYENKIIVLLTSEPIETPVTPVLFDLQMLRKHVDVGGNMSDFDPKVSDQNTVDVKQLSEEQGISKRHARRKTEEPRKTLKADRNAEIIRKHNAGMSGREIAKEMKIGLSTVQRIIKNQG